MGDNLLLADAEAVRLIDPAGAPIWSRGLGARSVSAASSDGAGGAWIVGTFADAPAGTGSADPFLVTSLGPVQSLGASANPFIVHLDAAGTVVGSGAWSSPVAFSQAVVAAGASGQPMLVARGATSDGWQVVAAFDATGALLWTRPGDAVTPLAVDATGALFTISSVVGDTATAVQIHELDPAGALVANVAAPVTLAPHQGFQVVTAPTPDGFVAVGETVSTVDDGSYHSCTPQHVMFRFQTQTMTATSEPLVGL
jgi:hypothetical protein